MVGLPADQFDMTLSIKAPQWKEGGGGGLTHKNKIVELHKETENKDKKGSEDQIWWYSLFQRERKKKKLFFF